LTRHCQAPILSYGIDNPGADVIASHVQLLDTGTRFTVSLPNGEVLAITSPLLAEFNVSNCLAAIAAAWSQGVAGVAIEQAVAQFKSVPGRMEVVECGQDFAVIIDYAHTAQSLRHVLTALRARPGKLIVVFGSAGDRDVPKREEMGMVAATYADWFIITDEDPRSEPADEIREQIAAGAEKAGAKRGTQFICIAGREVAIAQALGYAKSGDTVVLCGKGHEGSIESGGQSIEWNERNIVENLLAARSS
jgi:UDP-N-acetylmuramoyl-L-alanyl-D-glutamate--2,6-diaminopimelate ligase